MDTAYWSLFWTTGMPEAWLMSRDQAAAIQSAAAQSVDPSATDGTKEPADPGSPGASLR